MVIASSIVTCADAGDSNVDERSPKADTLPRSAIPRFVVPAIFEAPLVLSFYLFVFFAGACGLQHGCG
jgi:hypothetical protein